MNLLLGAVLLYFAIRWLWLICRRLFFAVKLRRACEKHKIRLAWQRNPLASLFCGRGKIDFVLDDRIHVAMLSTIHRRVRYHFFSPTLMQIYLFLSRTIVNRRARVYHENFLIPFLRYRLFLDEAESLPKDAAKILLVYPIPYALVRVDPGRSRTIGNDEPVHGGFEVNNKTHFFNQLESYAETGELSIWIARDPRKEV